jgi:hypothetical protein
MGTAIIIACAAAAVAILAWWLLHPRAAETKNAPLVADEVEEPCGPEPPVTFPPKEHDNPAVTAPVATIEAAEPQPETAQVTRIEQPVPVPVEVTPPRPVESPETTPANQVTVLLPTNPEPPIQPEQATLPTATPEPSPAPVLRSVPSPQTHEEESGVPIQGHLTENHEQALTTPPASPLPAVTSTPELPETTQVVSRPTISAQNHQSDQPSQTGVASPPTALETEPIQPDQPAIDLQAHGAAPEPTPQPEPPEDVDSGAEPEAIDGGGTSAEPARPRKVQRVIKLPSPEHATPRRKTPSTPHTDSTRERPPRVFAPPDISEFPGPVPGTHTTPCWEEYRRWNRALTSQFLLKAGTRSQAVLPITPRLLAAAWQKSEGTTFQPDEAATNLSKCVAALYTQVILPHPAGLKMLKSSVPDDLPLCTAFLALTVLAAYAMETDGAHSANAYYLRLSTLLRAGTDSTDLPFSKDDYYALWAYFQNWARDLAGAQVPLPDRNESTRFYVDLALSHVPLRKVDIERLPAFFLFADYGPGDSPPLHQLDAALQHWCNGNRRFTTAGTEALDDARRPAVLSQIAHELQAWDGVARNDKGQTVVNIELLLEFPNRRPTLMLVAKCPDGFPKLFKADGHTLESVGGGWYQPTPVLPIDGPRLQQGFTWDCPLNATPVALRRSPAAAIAFVAKDSQEHGSALVSNPGLFVGTKCAVMCLESLAGLVEQYLTRATGQQCRPIKPQGFPDNWVLFTAINIRNPIPHPQGLEALAPDSTIQILCSGGLRVDNAYLKGAPPRISVSGLPAATSAVCIDTTPVALDPDGFIIGSAELLTKGTHTIAVGNRVRKVEIVDSDLAHNLAVSPHSTASQHITKISTGVALPPGFWFVLGAGLGQIGQPRFANTQGTVFHCDFQPVWAVNCDNRKRPVVIRLSKEAPVPEKLTSKHLRRLRSHKKARQNASRWASCIRAAAHPRAQIFDAGSTSPSPTTNESWQSFRCAARQVARAIRSL